ncbi:MAE_28990/MAE_18760 family HEPN-like nuclease [Sorangium sp. So ce1036]|uniref:MAE_28990/MAE_18760 family HEPN-like nuclease n=1 Tax=Sorangium sp. So ce1036 TaxID=3133328 RepID=UPI003F0743C0
MKVRTAEDLLDLLDNSSQRRKRELTTVHAGIKDWRAHEMAFAHRAAVTFAYAHWEGFVKDAAQGYVAYVDNLGPPFCELIANFQALACKTKIMVAGAATKRIAPHFEVVGLFTQQSMQRVRIDAVKAIDTESNLTWEVFQNICLSIGVNVDPKWVVYAHWIDELFQSRCAIAHGALVQIEAKYANEAIRQVIDFLDWFKSDVENAAIMSRFRRPNAA